MSRKLSLSLSVLAVLGAGALPLAAQAQGMNPQQALTWHSARAPYAPSPNAVAGGPGDSPEPNSPMFICRAAVDGSLTPGKWNQGNCNVGYGGREIVARDYQVAYGQASWRIFGGREDPGLIQTGREANGTPLYSCRVLYRDGGRDVGYQPGKVMGNGKCDIAYGGREISVRGPFEALYAGDVGVPAAYVAPPPVAGGRRPVYNQYNQYNQYNRTRTTTVVHVEQHIAPPPPPQRPGQPRPLCRKGDPGVSFTAVGYAGPNCVTTNVYGEVAAYGNATEEERARYAKSDEPCKPGDASVHVENGMLVGADCKSVPEPVMKDNEADAKAQADARAEAEYRAAREAEAARQAEAKAAQDEAARVKAQEEQKAADEKAAADQRAAHDAEELSKAKEAQAKADAEKAAQEQAAQQQAEQQKAADEARAAHDAEELSKAKEAQAKADAERAAQEQAAQEKAAQEQKAAEEKAAADERAAGEAEELRMAKEAEAKAEAEKAAQQKAEEEKKAEPEPPPPPTEDTHAEPASGSSSG